MNVYDCYSICVQIGDTADIYVTEMKLFKNAQNQSEVNSIILNNLL